MALTIIVKVRLPTYSPKHFLDGPVGATGAQLGFSLGGMGLDGVVFMLCVLGIWNMCSIRSVLIVLVLVLVIFPEIVTVILV